MLSKMASLGNSKEDVDVFANQPIVIDNVSPESCSGPRGRHFTRAALLCLCGQGSGLMKAGFAGAELPKLCFPT